MKKNSIKPFFGHICHIVKSLYCLILIKDEFMVYQNRNLNHLLNLWLIHLEYITTNNLLCDFFYTLAKEFCFQYLFTFVCEFKINYFESMDSFLTKTCFHLGITHDQSNLLYMTWIVSYLYTIWNMHIHIKSNRNISSLRINSTLVQYYDESLTAFEMSIWFIVICYV